MSVNILCLCLCLNAFYMYNMCLHKFMHHKLVCHGLSRR